MQGYVFAWDIQNILEPSCGPDKLCLRSHPNPPFHFLYLHFSPRLNFFLHLLLHLPPQGPQRDGPRGVRQVQGQARVRGPCGARRHGPGRISSPSNRLTCSAGCGQHGEAGGPRLLAAGRAGRVRPGGLQDGQAPTLVSSAGLHCTLC